MDTANGQPRWKWACDAVGCASEIDDPIPPRWTSVITHGSVGEPVRTRDYCDPSCMLLDYGWRAAATIYTGLSIPDSGEAEPVRPIVYLIWSNSHKAWWRADRRGYTTEVERAGRYGEADALGIVRRSAHAGKLDAASVLVAAPDNWPSVERYGQGDVTVVAVES